MLDEQTIKYSRTRKSVALKTLLRMHLFALLLKIAVISLVEALLQFQCKDGSKVALRVVCDGTKNCRDGSDETSQVCGKSRCSSRRLFRCNYGACILRDLRCDGNNDCADASDESNCGHLSQSCKLSEWRCSSGTCIPLRATCNGTTECRDKSDETAQVCSASKCTGDTFRCEYGACISRSLICDDVPHCNDASDESGTVCGSGCKIPVVSPPLKVKIVGCNSPASCSSDLVPDLGVIEFTCPPNYKLQGEKFAFCVQRKLQPPTVPKCIPVSGEGQCPDFDDITPDILITCTSKSGVQVNCNRPMKVGTSATFQCRQNSLQSSESICMDGGLWSEKPPICEPKCGIARESAFKLFKSSIVPFSTGIDNNPIDHWLILPENIDTTSDINYNIGLIGDTPTIERPYLAKNDAKFAGYGPLIVHGADAFPGQWPWHAGLYYLTEISKNETEWKYQCGGTLVSDTAVVTAAHCVYKRNVTRLMIALGKFERIYNVSENDTQYMMIRDVYLPETYLGDINYYDSDIAVLGLMDKVQFGKNIRPACLDWKKLEVDNQLQEDNEAVLAGWGITENDTEAASLRYTRLKFVPLTKCLQLVSTDFRKFLRGTTFCAGTFNGTSACNGDSGGGLLFPLGEESANTQWVLHGVVSLSIRRPNNVLCDPKYPTVFTKVVNFLDFVISKMKVSVEAFEED